MANLIQIKRSQTTAVPTSLANGELAFTAAGNVIFIGNAGAVIPIGGERTPGVLTANQALVANSTSYINTVKTGELYVGSKSVNAIVTTGSTTVLGTEANNEIASTYAIKTYVEGRIATVTGGEVTSALSANNASNLGGYAATDYLRKAESATLSGNLNITAANTTISNLNVTTINRSPVITLAGDLSGSVTLSNLGDATLTATIAADSVALGTDTTGDYVASVSAANGVSVSATSGEGSTPSIGVVAGNGLTVNTSGVHITPRTISLSGDVTGSATYDGTGTVTINTTVTNAAGVELGADTTGDYVANVVAGDGIAFTGTSTGEGSTPTIKVLAGTGVTANSSGVHIGQPVGTTDNVTFNNLTVNGNTVLGSDSADIVTPNGRFAGSLVPSANVTYSLGTDSLRWSDLYLGGTTIYLGSAQISSEADNTVLVANLHSTGMFTANNGLFHGNLGIDGNLTVNGSLVYMNVENISTEDPLIKLASNNISGDLVDIGLFGVYSDGTTKYTGLFRDASHSGKYRLFSGLETDPTTVVDFGGTGYTVATLHSYLDSGALQTTGSSVTITANSTVSVSITANTLTLGTPLAATSGGTGYSDYTTGDLLYASSSTALGKLGIGAEGTVLQVSGGVLAYSGLDGGTF